MTRLELRLKSGETAFVLATDGDKTTIESPLSAPPGSTVDLTIPGAPGELHLKVTRCRRVGDVFHVDGRLRNAPRELKAILLAPPRDESL